MIDASIYSQFLKPVKSVQEYASEYDAAEQNQIKLAALRRGERQATQDMSEGNAFQALLRSGVNMATPEGQSKAYGVSASRTDALLKQIADRKAVESKAGMDASHGKLYQADAEQKAFETKLKAVDHHTQSLDYLQTPKDVIDYIDGGVRKGLWDQEKAAIMKQRADGMPSVQAFVDASKQNAIPLLEKFKAEQEMRKAKLQSDTSITTTRMGNETSLANTKLTTDTSVLTNKATNDRMASEGAANRGVQMRGQNLTDGRARERLTYEQGSAIADSGGVSQAQYNKQFGKPGAGYRWKADGSQEFIPGGPADQKAQSKTAGEGSVDGVVAELRSKYDSLDKAGGITNPAKGPIDNLTAGIASSGPGQAAGRMFGTANQSERNAVAMTRPLLLQAIMKATGMSAKQMDSNAELKLYLATATDPTLDVKANREALDRIEQLYGSGAKGTPAPASKNPKRIKLDAQGNIIP